MTISTIISLLTAIFTAIPKLKDWFDELVAMYVRQEIETLKKENTDAIRKAINEKDQRDIEIALGSPHAGLPSGIDGTSVVDGLPGVQDGHKG